MDLGGPDGLMLDQLCLAGGSRREAVGVPGLRLRTAEAAVPTGGFWGHD